MASDEQPNTSKPSSSTLKGLRKSRTKSQPKEKKGIRFDLIKIILGFALVSFCTSFYFNSSSGKTVSADIPAEGGILGPLTVTKKNQVYEVSISQPGMLNRDWRFIQGELLDEKQQYIMSFGKELWYEEGYDSEGRWTEGDRDYQMKLTLPKAGTYYIRFSSESSPSSNRRPTFISIAPKHGSGMAHMIFGILLLIGGVGTYFGTGGWEKM